MTKDKDKDLDNLPISDLEKAFLLAVRKQYEAEMVAREVDQERRANPLTDK